MNLKKKKVNIVKPPKKIQIKTHIADTAGCGHIRMIIPSMLLNQYRHNGFQFYSEYSSYFITSNPIHYKNFTYTVIQRAVGATLERIKIFKDKIQNIVKVPIFYEIDDNLVSDIPEWNFASDYYKIHRESVENILRLVDGISVSTNKLKNLYTKYNDNIVINKNHLCKFMWPETIPRIKETNKPKIVYPCSQNHFSNKPNIKGGDIGNVLMNFIKKTTDKYEWIFIGGLPMEMKCLVLEGKIKNLPWQTIWNYPKFLCSQNADIGIAPLSQCEFNACKSDIKVLEFTAAGIPGVYTDIEPYKYTNLKSKNEEEFIFNIEKLADDPDLRLSTWKADYEKIKDYLFWEDNNNLFKYVNNFLSLVNLKLEGE